MEMGERGAGGGTGAARCFAPRLGGVEGADVSGPIQPAAGVDHESRDNAGKLEVGRFCGGGGRGTKALSLVAAKRGVGEGEGSALADAGGVFLPVRKTRDAQRRSVSSVVTCEGPRRGPPHPHRVQIRTGQARPHK